MGSLLEGGKNRMYEHMVYMKDDEKIRIRILDATLARRVFIHSCKDAANRFIDVLCVGLNSGCKFCQANKLDPKYKDIKDNSMKPYPGRQRYVKPVYVYEKQKVILLGGKEVWQQIDTINAMFGTVLDRDIVVMRKKEDRVTYVAQGDAPSAFNINLDPATFPKVDDYINWLRANIDEAVMVDSLPVIATVGAVSPFTVQVAPVAGPVTVATPGVVDGRQALMDEVTDLLTSQRLDQPTVLECMREVAPSKSKFGEYTEEELKKFKDLYNAKKAPKK